MLPAERSVGRAWRSVGRAWHSLARPGCAAEKCDREQTVSRGMALQKAAVRCLLEDLERMSSIKCLGFLVHSFSYLYLKATCG